MIEKKLKESGEKIEIINHLADIHIRKSTNRHEEYKKVFERLYRELKKEKKKSVTVICGDILHEKCNYNEISLEVVFEFMEKLVNITDVIMIMGNHDGYTLKENRRDALEPIVNRIKGKNKLYYLKDSGIYEYENIVFGVSSIYDEKEVRSEEIKSNKTKIALYHGSVYGTKLQNEYIMEKYDKRIEDFEGYEYVLLGDIHKHQYITERIAYPSSLIQQSHGEDLINHGYIRWNIKKKTSEYKRIKNNYGYITIRIEEGEIKDKIEKKKIPKNVRVRVIYRKTEKRECKKIISEYLIEKKIESIVWHEEYENKKKIYIDTLTTDISDINDVNYQNKLINEYYRNENINMSEICKLNKKLNEKISNRINRVKGIKWEPLRVRFSNMFSYGVENEINFEKLEGVVGIIAPNHYGKSSILDIILFALYDRCSKSNIRSDIMNINSNTMYCEMIFKVNEERYKIVRRSRTNKKKVKSLRIEVDFYKEINEKYVCISGKDRNETNQIISEYVGTYEDIVMTHISLQKDINFLDLTQSKRIDYLVKILGIDIFESLHKEGKKRLNEKIGVYKKMIEDYERINDNKIFEEQQEKKKEEKRVEKEIKEGEREIEEMTEEINKLYMNMEKVKKKKERNSLEEIEERKIENIEEEKKRREKEIEERRREMEEIDKRIEEINYEDKEIEEIKERQRKEEEERNKRKEEIENKIINLIEKKEKIKTLESEIKIINEKKKIEKENEEKEKEIKKIEKEIKEIKIEEIRYNKLEEEEEIRKEYEELKKLEKEKEKEEEELEKKKEKEREIEEINKELKDYKYDPKCEYCVKNPFTKKARKKEKEMNKIKKEIEKKKKKIESQMGKTTNQKKHAVVSLKILSAAIQAGEGDIWKHGHYANRSATAPVMMIRTESTRRGVNASFKNQVPNRTANSTDVSRRAATAATGATVIAHSAIAYELTDAAAPPSPIAQRSLK